MKLFYLFNVLGWRWTVGRETLFFLTLLTSTIAKHYRSDYVYNRKTDAFYKFHIETVWFTQSKDLCDVEGAELMVPTSDEDIAQVHAMFKQYPDIGDIAWIDSDGKHHDSAEETPIIYLDDEITPWNYGTRGEYDVVTRDGEIKTIQYYQKLPFFCKVEARYTFYDSRCKVFGKDYKYFENVGSCYRIPRKAFQWNKAYQECHAEGAHLVVLNSEVEQAVVRNLTHTEPPAADARVSYFFFAGIRAQKKTDGSPIVFKTVFNQTMVEAGYDQWTGNEPNNYMGIEYCVSIFRGDGKYNDIDCSDMLSFICEKEI